MNPIAYEKSEPVPDYHGHRCPLCGTSWWHRKSELPAGGVWLAHCCPRCGVEVSERLTVVPDRS